MAKKYKLTGCAKFFIFFIIAAPLAYLGASYYNGQDPVKQVKEFVESISFSKGDPESGSTDSPTVTNGAPGQTSGTVYQKMELKDLEIKTLKNDLDDCKSINKKQKELIEALEKENEAIKQQSTK